MIDLLSAWFGGFLLSMFFCVFVVMEFPKKFRYRAAPLILLAMLWPVICVAFIYWMWNDKK